MLNASQQGTERFNMAKSNEVSESNIVTFPAKPSPLSEPTITSVALAEQLGVEHKYLLRIIRKVIKEDIENLAVHHMHRENRLDERGKLQPQHIITEAGLLLLSPHLSIKKEVVISVIRSITKLKQQNIELIQNRISLLEGAANPEALVLMKSKYGSSFSKETPKEKKWVLVREWDDEHRKFTKRKALAQDLTDLALWESVVEKCQLELEGKQAALRLRERYMNVLREWHESGCSGARPKPSSVGVNSKYDVFF